MRCSDWFPEDSHRRSRAAPGLAAPAGARDMFGVRTGFYTDVDEPFIGIEGLFGLGNHVYLNPNFEYVFTEDPHYMTFNADFHSRLPDAKPRLRLGRRGSRRALHQSRGGRQQHRRRAQPAVRRGPQGPRGPLRPGKGDRVGRHSVRAGIGLRFSLAVLCRCASAEARLRAARPSFVRVLARGEQRRHEAHGAHAARQQQQAVVERPRHDRVA